MRHKVKLIGDLQGLGRKRQSLDVVLPMAPFVGMVVEFTASQRKKMKTDRTSFVVRNITINRGRIECGEGCP